MAKKPDTSSRIADNKKAAYNYFFEERHEAGMVLHGWEVKALREGKVQLTDDAWTWLRGVPSPGTLVRGTIAMGTSQVEVPERERPDPRDLLQDWQAA